MASVGHRKKIDWKVYVSFLQELQWCLFHEVCKQPNRVRDGHQSKKKCIPINIRCVVPIFVCTYKLMSLLLSLFYNAFGKNFFLFFLSFSFFSLSLSSLFLVLSLSHLLSLSLSYYLQTFGSPLAFKSARTQEHRHHSFNRLLLTLAVIKKIKGTLAR